MVNDTAWPNIKNTKDTSKNGLEIATLQKFSLAVLLLRATLQFTPDKMQQHDGSVTSFLKKQHCP